MRIQPGQVGAALAAGLAGALVLLRFPPAMANWYPDCPFHAVTGWLCPGCGATHALAALLRGQGAEAWRDNALLVCLLPVLAVYVGLALFQRVREENAEWPAFSMRQTATLVGLAVGFAVWRNLAR